MATRPPKAPLPLYPPAPSKERQDVERLASEFADWANQTVAVPDALSVGKHVRDSLSGIKGQVVARTEWLHRSPEVAVARLGRDAEGKPWDLIWMDEAHVSICTKDE